MIIFIAELDVLCFSGHFEQCKLLVLNVLKCSNPLQCTKIFFCVFVSVSQIQLFQLSFCIGGTL